MRHRFQFSITTIFGMSWINFSSADVSTFKDAGNALRYWDSSEEG
jgi:hypothetical protein